MEKKLAIEFGKRLVVERNKKNLLQKELSALCGFSQNYIGLIERGEKNISLEKVYIIAKVLECSVIDLLPNEADIDL